MGSRKKDVADAAEEQPKEQGKFRIEYTQGDEAIVLTFHDAERRDHEYSRLVAQHIHGLNKVDAE